MPEIKKPDRLVSDNKGEQLEYENGQNGQRALVGLGKMAELAGRDPKTITRYVHEGMPVADYSGKRRLFNPEVCKRWIKNRTGGLSLSGGDDTVILPRELALDGELFEQVQAEMQAYFSRAE